MDLGLATPILDTPYPYIVYICTVSIPSTLNLRLVQKIIFSTHTSHVFIQVFVASHTSVTITGIVVLGAPTFRIEWNLFLDHDVLVLCSLVVHIRCSLNAQSYMFSCCSHSAIMRASMWCVNVYYIYIYIYRHVANAEVHTVDNTYTNTCILV